MTLPFMIYSTSIAYDCAQLNWLTNGVDEDGFGEHIGPYQEGWFVGAEDGDFHLSVAGAVAIGDIAEWQDGDPIVDIDGDPRPMDTLGRPGLDEP